MITRNQIVALLIENHDKTKEEKTTIISDFCDSEQLTPEDKEKIMADIGSYGEF
jgi:hypothetical protein